MDANKYISIKIDPSFNSKPFISVNIEILVKMVEGLMSMYKKY